MDLRLMAAEPTNEERSAVDAVLGPPGSGWKGGEREPLDGHVARGGRAAREERHLLLPALHALQSRVGWISEGGLNYVSQRLTIPPAEAFGVASFYAMFSTEPRPKRVFHLCDDIACRVAGAEALIGDVVRDVGPDRADELVRSPCLGMCDRAPAALMQTAGERASDVALGPVSMELLDPFLHGGSWTIRGGPGAPRQPRRGPPAAPARRARRPELARRLPCARRVRGASARGRARARGRDP